MNYTSEQIKKHGDLILLWENSNTKPVIQFKNLLGEWIDVNYDYLLFDVKQEYRVKQLSHELSREEITANWVKENNLKVGDKVKVVKGFENYFGGIPKGVSDEVVGKITIVDSIRSEFIKLMEDEKHIWHFPVESLEKVEEKWISFDGTDYPLFRDKWVKCKPILTEQISIQKVVGFNVESEQVLIGASWTHLKCAFEEYELEDGTPFGKKYEA